MNWSGIIWGGVLISLFTVFMVTTDTAKDSLNWINQQVSSVWAQYMAESSIDKALYAIKSEDVNVTSGLNNFNAIQKKDSQFWSMNAWADTWYFDLTLNASPSGEIDLWTLESADIVFENTQVVDYFDTFILNYNNTSNKDVVVEVVKFRKWGWYQACDLYDNLDNKCNWVEKFVINTSDATMNGMVKDGYVTRFLPGENPFKNKLTIQWFNSNTFDYRVTLNTLQWWNTEVSYYITESWNKKKVVNNLVEIDTIWNAIDSFSRMKLTKKVANEVQPITKYVLFSNSEIIK